MPASIRSRSTGLSARSWTGNSETSQQPAEVVWVDGLDEMGVEAGLFRALPVLRLAIAGERDHEARLRGQEFHAPRHLVAVEAGQPDVDERDVGPLRAGQIETFGAVGRRVDFVTVELEQGTERVPRVDIVLDEEDLRHAFTVTRAPSCVVLTPENRRWYLVVRTYLGRRLLP